MSLLPKGVIEITPHLYIGPESAVRAVLLKHKCRHVLRAMEENTDYNAILQAERQAREPWMKVANKKEKKLTKEELAAEEAAFLAETEVDAEDDNEKKAELDAVVGDTSEKKASTVEELPDDAAPEKVPETAGGGDTKKDEEKCGKCGLPVEDQGSSGDPKQQELKEEVYTKEQLEFNFLSVPVRSHFCPMEDDLQYDITKMIPKAVDWLGRILGELGGDRDIPHYDRSAAGGADEGGATEEEEGAAAAEDEEARAAEEDVNAKATEKRKVDFEELVGGGRSNNATSDNNTNNNSATAGVTNSPPMLKPDEPLDMSRAVYLHCYAGASRSPTVLLAYLMARKEMPLQKAVDEYLPMSCRPNPSFIHQLMMLEEMFFGEPSNFDVQAYNIDGLSDMFQNLSRDECEDTLVNKCRGNVLEARNSLMKAELKAMNRERLMIQALMTSAGRLVTEADAEDAWKESGKNRDQALYVLMKKQEEKLAAANGTQTTGSDIDDYGVPV